MPARSSFAIACALLLFTGCELKTPTPDTKQRPGTALESFKRELGLRGSSLSVEGKAAGGLSSELADRWRSVSRRAYDLLSVLRQRDGRLSLSRLPAGPKMSERLAYARGLIELGRPLEAEPVLEKLLREEPRFFPASEALGICAMMTKNWARARDHLGRYLGFEPSDSSARRRWALVSLRLEDYREEAVSVLKGMLDSKEDASGAAAVLSDWYFSQQDYKSAVAVLSRAMEKGDRSLINRYQLGVSLSRMNRFKDAREILEEVIALPSSQQGSALLELIQVERNLGDFKKANDYYQRLRSGNFASFRQGYGLEAFEALGQRIHMEVSQGRAVTRRVVDVRVRFLDKSVEREERRESFSILVTAVAQKKYKPEKLLADLRRVLEDESDDWGMRVFALGAHLRFEPKDLSVLAAALQAKEPRLRKRATSILGRLGRAADLTLIFRALERESDPACFRALHECLGKLKGSPVFLGFDAEKQAETRRKAVEAWAKELSLELKKD
ncbi:MAG: hypothetical protein CSA62_04800 [Planctomycetota bacterium]|nr:MAG: hypothetical protein CSA62_04800 [Planctomycetota bacterium]